MSLIIFLADRSNELRLREHLHLHPKLLIMDEATSMLDPQGRDEVIRIVKELKRKTGLTVISITHDLEEALLADRIIVMNQGKVLTIGTPEANICTWR